MNILQRKSSMVLYAFEQSIGDFVLNYKDLNIGSRLIEDITEREISKGRSFDPNQIKDVVEATYLGELFQIAIDLTSNDSSHDLVKYLYSLFHDFEIHLVRNAISHPNRQFLDFFWYRLAAVATDPVIDILGLDKVKKAFISANEGILDDPPDDWLNKVVWEIPNNLPSTFEHAVTGLIGRNKERKQLETYMSQPRVSTVALVAPGGVGKTALALDLLHYIVHRPSAVNRLDGVVFVTLKTEKLTAQGIQQLTAIQTIAEVKNKIVESINDIFDEDLKNFEDVASLYDQKRILLCIDNLETVLREEQILFDDFNNTLPGGWKVLITSRITVENTKTLSLHPLDQKSGEILARKYQESRGISTLENHDYEKISKACFFNPLAIRLTIDLINLGRDIPTSISEAQKNIAEFSYNNLIEALKPTSIQILEAIFVENVSTRASLCHVLEKDLDEISDSVGELSRTSLIVKASQKDIETYSLNDSIKDLLLLDPKNLEVRNKVQNKLLEQKNQVREIDFHQEKRQYPIWHRDNIPLDTPEGLKILVKNVNMAVRRKGETSTLSELIRKLRDAENIYKTYAIYYKSLAKLLDKLSDSHGQKDALLKGLAIDDTNPNILYMLARYYADQGDYEASTKQYQKLIELGWIQDNEENIEFSRTIYNGYFLNLLYSKEYQRILDETKKWKEDENFSPLLGVYRATAWKRTIELYGAEESDKIESAINSSLAIFDEVFRKYGYSVEACKQATKVFEEIIFYANNPLKSDEKLKIFLEKTKKNITEISNTYLDYDWTNLYKKLSSIQISDNPFYNLNRSGYKSPSQMYADGSKEGDFIFVKIETIRNNYLFSSDKNQTQYFVHSNQYRGDVNWYKLKEGELLKVHPLPPDSSQSAIKVKAAFSC
ncbi:TPA: hypothetical protein ACSE9U_003662 [Acinetobacter baumannii]|uniref:ATP-binding protein n=10 Tax=Gammaproteobacteria TaxID=1236 RepID=UPI0004507F6F|nr:ATP-binding protein [Acinetobacter baumannii]HBR2322863.1 hypothetical protein [Klebsiella pneumoniae]EKX8118407.1 hypothetical protein [Acinetobacter baumannii]EZF12266.1 hypothetical protein BA71_03832 [Acinetobacter baumannii LAC-4]KAB1103172.1 hypothetical protein F6W75_19045 [Acinetobacter baumannii]MCA4423389.1 hypothetical protein [Acinetobacter baumannii]